MILADAKTLADFHGYLAGGRGGECEDARNAQLASETGNFEVIGPEVMPPLRDAMRFIDG